jgi:hypothetical protein
MVFFDLKERTTVDAQTTETAHNAASAGYMGVYGGIWAWTLVAVSNVAPLRRKRPYSHVNEGPKHWQLYAVWICWAGFA